MRKRAWAVVVRRVDREFIEWPLESKRSAREWADAYNKVWPGAAVAHPIVLEMRFARRKTPTA